MFKIQRVIKAICLLLLASFVACSSAKKSNPLTTSQEAPSQTDNTQPPILNYNPIPSPSPTVSPSPSPLAKATGMRASIATTNRLWEGACIPILIEFIDSQGRVAPLDLRRDLVLNPGDTANSIGAGFYVNDKCIGIPGILLSVAGGSTSVNLYFKSPKARSHETKLSMTTLSPPSPAFTIVTESLPVLVGGYLTISGIGGSLYHCPIDEGHCKDLEVPESEAAHLHIGIGFDVRDEAGLDLSLYHCRRLFSHYDESAPPPFTAKYIIPIPAFSPGEISYDNDFVETFTPELIQKFYKKTFYYGASCYPLGSVPQNDTELQSITPSFFLQYRIKFI